jgi:Flp pilus assembly protein TadG
MKPQDSTPRIGQRKPSRCGATLVEFAITAPVFMLFLMGAFEFGWLNVMRHTADNAAYEAARHAMVPGATAAEAVAKAKSILNVVGARGAKVSVSPTTITSSTPQVSVTVDIPVSSNALIVPRFTGGKTLRSTSTLRTERAK